MNTEQLKLIAEGMGYEKVVIQENNQRSCM